MRYWVGLELSFWNKRTQSLDKIVVTELSGDGIGFQFRYQGKLYKTTYAQSKGKLFRYASLVPEYQDYLRSENQRRSRLQAESEIKNAERERKKLVDPPPVSPKPPIVATCDNCFHRWSGDCTLLKNDLCDDYRAGPVQDYSTNGPTGDKADYRPIWH